MRQAIGPQNGTGFELATGEILEVIDPLGGQVADLFCFSVHDPTDTLSSGRSIDRGERLLFTTGSVLYAQSGRPMLKILSDTCGRNDFLVPPCNRQNFLKPLGERTLHHHNCLENLSLAFTPFPVYRDKIGTTFNIFMNVRLDDHGHIQIEKPLSKPGDSIRFLAMMDVYVGMTACSHHAVDAHHGSHQRIEYEITSTALI